MTRHTRKAGAASLEEDDWLELHIVLRVSSPASRGLEEYLRLVLARSNWEATHRLGDVAVPTLVVVGDGDVVGANHVKQATLLINRIPERGIENSQRPIPRLFLVGTTRNKRVDYRVGSEALAAPTLTNLSAMLQICPPLERESTKGPPAPSTCRWRRRTSNHGLSCPVRS